MVELLGYLVRTIEQEIDTFPNTDPVAPNTVDVRTEMDETITPVIPGLGHFVVIELVDPIRVIDYAAEFVAQRPARIDEIALGRPGLRGLLRPQLPQAFVEELPADRDPQEHQQKAGQKADLSHVSGHDSILGNEDEVGFG